MALMHLFCWNMVLEQFILGPFMNMTASVTSSFWSLLEEPVLQLLFLPHLKFLSKSTICILGLIFGLENWLS